MARGGAVFVGRVPELEELDRVLDATRAGSGATVLIAGPAGIGKTRLASELGRRARTAGFETLVGRSIDLVGTELPYQPFVEALRALGHPWQVEQRALGSQLRLFESTLDLLTDRTATAPLMLVLEDLHWADVSTLDLVVFLAHNLHDRPILLLATFRPDEPASTQRIWRLADGVRRSGSGVVLDLGPLELDALTALLEAHSEVPVPTTLVNTIMARSEGNPFFAEELLAAARDGEDLPRGLRDLLLQRVVRLNQPTQSVLRLAAAAGREVGYQLLHAMARLPESELRDSLRQSVEQGVLLSEPETGTFRFRHALLAEAIYATILPGEFEELHARLAEELARGGRARAAELAPHWAAAGRTTEALVASLEAARESQAVFGLAEAHGHLERALVLWDTAPDAPELAGIDLAELCTWAAELASQTGAAPRAVELGRRAIELVGAEDKRRAGMLHVRLGEYLHATGSSDDLLAAFERAVELVPAEPPSPEGAYALGSVAGALMVAQRFEESLAISEKALVLARGVGAREAEVRALTVLGVDLAYLGHGTPALVHVQQALQLAEEIGDRVGLERAYVNFTDALTMLGQCRASARLGKSGLEAMHRYGIESTLLVSNQLESLLAIGDWREADELSAAALRATTASFPHYLLLVRADLEVGRGDFDAARKHLEDARATLREDRGLGNYFLCVAELALWEQRWTEAVQAVGDGLRSAHSRHAAQQRVSLCAKGLRAHAELTALARARRDADAVNHWLAQARKLIAIARRAAADASEITPNAAGWLALAEAEHEHARGAARPELWSEVTTAWDRLERPPLAAYCRLRWAEALVATNASRAEAGVPLRQAYAVAARIGANPLLRDLDLLAQRARLDLAPLEPEPPEAPGALEKTLGLTPREAEVLRLVARGYTNRDIASTLVISTKTASVHVSHILQKLDVSNRLEAAAIAHRVAPPPLTLPEPNLQETSRDLDR
jgi:DNA-binding CsgD family transcriptional regulator